ncbi:B12-binding domain-containing radical SAM protein [Candidatus Woesearchaeota archaeon]|nr:B12-binding domain-containing radical SAM protein [Candidatus Woesearchaeota archaeon]
MGKEQCEVLLVNPGFNQKSFQFYQNIPVDLLEIGSYLTSKGVKVKIADCSIREKYVDYIKELAKDVLLVGIGVMNAQIVSALEIMKAIRSVNPNVKFVWGGAHSTLYPEQTISHKDIDFIVVGEGEEPLYNLYLSVKNNTSYENIKGIGFKKDGKVVINPAQPLIDVNKLPMPDWSLIDEEMLELYRNNTTQTFFPVSTSRGCPHRCTFCINVVTKNRWRGKSPEKVLDELSYVYNNLGITKIRFRDELFFVDKQRVKAILKGLIDRNIKIDWRANCKADYFRRGLIDDELLKYIKESGCSELGIGAESGSQRMLDLIEKDNTVEDILNMVRTCSKWGIRGNYSFMIGLPYETKKEMISTIKLIKKIKKIEPDSFIIGPQPYRPYPGGKMFEQAVSLGWKEPQSLEAWYENYSEMLFAPTSKLFPWIEDPTFVDYLLIYTKFASNSLKQIKERYVSGSNGIKAPGILIYLFAVWCKLRWALGVYDNFFEIKLIEKYYNRTIKKNQVNPEYNSKEMIRSIAQ